MRTGCPCQRRQAPVDPGAEADIPARPHDSDGKGQALPPELLKRGGGAAGGTVLHHHDGAPPIPEEGPDAAFEQRPGVVVDNDGGGDLAGHPALSTPG